MITGRILDTILLFCTYLINDLFLDVEDFLDLNCLLITVRFFEDTLFFCFSFIDISLTHRLFLDFGLLLFERFDTAFIDIDLLFIAVLRLIVPRTLLIVRPFLLTHFVEMAVFFTGALLQLFFFVIQREFDLDTLYDVLLHLLFMLVIAILLSGIGLVICIMV